MTAYASKHFPDWGAWVPPEVMRRADALIDAFAAGEADLLATVLAFNDLETHIDTPSAEELSEKLIEISGLDVDTAGKIIDSGRTW